MSVDFVRIDDRLIHAQIILGWAAIINPDCLIVANDEAAGDCLRSRILYAASSELSEDRLSIKILSVKSCAALLKSMPQERHFISIAGPCDAVSLIEEGISIKDISLGWMSYSSGRKQIFPTVYASDEEIKAFKRLIDMGVRINYQASPSEDQKNLDISIFS